MESGVERFAKRLGEAIEQAEIVMDNADKDLVLSLRAMADAGEFNPTYEHRKVAERRWASYSRWAALLDVQQMLADEVGVRIASMGSE